MVSGVCMGLLHILQWHYLQLALSYHVFAWRDVEMNVHVWYRPVVTSARLAHMTAIQI